METAIRFFICDFSAAFDDYYMTEVEEEEFIRFEGGIEYKRHTMHDNGIDQVCLTKGLPKG